MLAPFSPGRRATAQDRHQARDNPLVRVETCVIITPVESGIVSSDTGAPVMASWPPLLPQGESLRGGEAARLLHSDARYSIFEQTFVYYTLFEPCPVRPQPREGARTLAQICHGVSRCVHLPNVTTRLAIVT